MIALVVQNCQCFPFPPADTYLHQDDIIIKETIEWPMYTDAMFQWESDVLASMEGRVRKMIERLIQLGVEVPRPIELQEYLLQHPGIIEPLDGLIMETLRSFPRSENYLSVIVEQDEEEPDFKCVVIKLFTDVSGELLVNKIEDIEGKYPLSPGEKGCFFILPEPRS